MPEELCPRPARSELLTGGVGEGKADAGRVQSSTDQRRCQGLVLRVLRSLFSHSNKPQGQARSPLATQRQHCSELFFYSPQKPLEAPTILIPPLCLHLLCGLRCPGNCRSRVVSAAARAQLAAKGRLRPWPRRSGLQHHPSTKGFRFIPSRGCSRQPIHVSLIYISLPLLLSLRKINYKAPSGEGLKESDGVPGKTRQNHTVTEPTLFSVRGGVVLSREEMVSSPLSTALRFGL